MATINITDLNTDKALDKAALSKILGGNATAVAGNSIAYAGNNGVFAHCWPSMAPHCSSYGPRAFQLNYNTSFEKAYYQRYDQSLNLSYFQA